MSLYHDRAVYEAVIITPGGDGFSGLYQLTVGDILAFSDRLRELDIPHDALVHDTAAIRPQPVLGLQVLREVHEPLETGDAS